VVEQAIDLLYSVAHSNADQDASGEGDAYQAVPEDTTPFGLFDDPSADQTKG